MCRGKAALVGVCLVVLTGVGCGSGDSTTALTKGQFLAQGNAICQNTEKEQARNYKKVLATMPASTHLSRVRKKKLLTEIFIHPYEKMVGNVKGLGAPNGDEGQVEAIIEAMEQGQKKVESEPLQLLRGSTGFKEADELATEYGLKDCAL